MIKKTHDDDDDSDDKWMETETIYPSKRLSKISPNYDEKHVQSIQNFSLIHNHKRKQRKSLKAKTLSLSKEQLCVLKCAPKSERIFSVGAKIVVRCLEGMKIL